MKKNVIAIVGAGKGGAAIINYLLKIPSVEIRYICDIDENAPGIKIALGHGITCWTKTCYPNLLSDSEIDLIFEITGKVSVFEKLDAIKNPHATLIGSSGAKIIFHLLDDQEIARKKLVEYKEKLEDKIVERTEELERANIDLNSKIEAYKILYEKLQTINNEKTRYLLQATHQLKAPFAAIQSYTDIILDGYVGDISDRTRGILNKVKVRCDLLAGSIKEMLSLANLKSTVKENLKLNTESLADILEKVISKNGAMLNRRKMELVLDSGVEDDTILCNRDQIEIMFSVLIENAINYSHDSSTIEVVITGEGPGLTVEVRDVGIGIAPESIPKIFDEYYRSNEAARQHINGNGLGLAIVREIANIHNINIEVKSVLGKGTTFVLTFKWV